MAKQIVYIVEETELTTWGYGDSWEQDCTFDLEKAKSSAICCLNHLTESEKKKREITIRGFEAEVVGTASECMDALMEEFGCYPDPVYYEEIKDENIR